jgi:CubicO group peptidase (beta-lactamase class C family)
MPDGEGYLGGGAYLRPRDFLKIGQLYLDGGIWKGEVVVNASWVKISTTAHAHISPATTGIDSARFGDFYGEADDGYAWHLTTLRSGAREFGGYAATGNGGQVLMVVPELELAVVFTAGNYGQGGIWTRFGSEIVPREIIPAIQR